MSGESESTLPVADEAQRSEKARVKAETRARLIRQKRCPGCGRGYRGHDWSERFVSCPTCRRYQRIVAGEFRARERAAAATSEAESGGSAATERESEAEAAR